MKITPRDYQRESVEAMKAYAKNNPPSSHAYVELPTGSGKSVVIADFCEQLVRAGKRVLVLCRQGELVKQNAERLEQLADGVKVGIYSASLGRKDVDADVIFGTVQSVARSVHNLGRINCILVDEAHQIPPKADSQYGKVVNEIRKYQPKCRLFGLTASPYRTSSGLIHGEGKIFDECCYQVPLQKMLDDGHISPWTLPDVSKVDLSNVHIKGGEYDIEEMSDAFIAKVEDNAREVLGLCEGRRRVLVFASSIAHANALSLVLGRSGAHTAMVTGDTHRTKRETILDVFTGSNPKQIILINVGVLTTGFDAPNVDAVVLCRATKSAGLFYQILGRGMRRCEGKSDFLVLDFGGNFDEHGDPTDPNFGRSEKEAKRLMCDACKVFAPAEDCRCPQCGVVLDFKACPACGNLEPKDARKCTAKKDPENLFSDLCEFDFLARRCRNVKPDASECLAIVDKEDETCLECQNAIDRALQEGKTLKNSCVKAEKYWWKVEEVEYNLHKPKDEGKPPSLRVVYKCVREETDDLIGKKVALRGRFMEWICFEHEGFAQGRARKWWGESSSSICPDSVVEAEELIAKGAIREPFLILTQADGKWQRIIQRKFNQDKPERVFLDFEEEDDDCPF